MQWHEIVQDVVIFVHYDTGNHLAIIWDIKQENLTTNRRKVIIRAYVGSFGKSRVWILDQIGANAFNGLGFYYESVNMSFAYVYTQVIPGYAEMKAQK